MKVTVYKALKSPSAGVTLFLILPAEKEASDIPQGIYDKYGKFNVFKKELELKSGEPRLGVDVERALKEISDRGFCLSTIEINVREKV